MDGPLISINTAVAVLGEVWAGALPPFGLLDSDDVSVLVGQMDDGGLLALLDRVTDLGRRVDAVTAAVAGEVAERSPVGSRADGLAHRSGFASPARLVAASTGGHVGRAAVLASVGKATAGRRSLTGEALPAVHPHVAAVLHEGGISVDAAQLIICMLERVASRVAPDVLESAEEFLAGKAALLSLDQVVKLVTEMESALDPEGVEPREEVLREGRSLVVKEDTSGRIQLRGVFDPETGAPIKAALDAYVSFALRETRGHNHPGGTACDAGAAGAGAEGGAGAENGAGAAADAAGDNGVPSAGAGDLGDRMGARVMSETRSTAQLRADGLADFARHVLGCTDRVPGLPATTVVVRMDVEDLQDREGGCGFATLDGIDQPVSVATARRVACTAGLLPAVFGGASLPLDLGREARLFSRYQFLALWERDGGCASCGQTMFVEAHHIVEHALGGRTDLSNGVLLCSRCHHRVHRDEWEIRIDTAGRVWFIPPPTIDPTGTPRPGVQRQTLRERNRHKHDNPEH